MGTVSESSVIREPSDFSLAINDSIWIKRFFLSFLQAYFQEHTKYTWKYSSHDTGIIIVDKFAMDLDVVSKKPALVLSRGPMRWMNTSIGQRSYVDLISDNREYTDLLQSSVTINCIAKNGLVCEELALIVRNVLTGQKDQLRKNGLHKILAIDVGEERAMSINVEPEVSVVPVNIVFTKQTNLTSLQDFYTSSLKIAFDGSNYGGFSGIVFDDTVFPMQLYENRDYVINVSGTSLTFISGMAPPTGATLSINYLENVSLTEVSESPTGDINGSNRTFLVDNAIYGYSPRLNEVKISGIANA